MSKAFLSVSLNNLDDTKSFGDALAGVLKAGDVICFEGPLGAGKTELARAILQAKMKKYGTWEDVPSPSFTLIQLYEFKDVDIWHADLYRLSGPDDVWELGLLEAMETSICLIEWPDRLGQSIPENALFISMKPVDRPEKRQLIVRGEATWKERLKSLQTSFADA